MREEEKKAEKRDSVVNDLAAEFARLKLGEGSASRVAAGARRYARERRIEDIAFGRADELLDLPPTIDDYPW